MFSATMPREVRALADEVLQDPHVVELAHSMRRRRSNMPSTSCGLRKSPTFCDTCWRAKTSIRDRVPSDQASHQAARPTTQPVGSSSRGARGQHDADAARPRHERFSQRQVRRSRSYRHRRPWHRCRERFPRHHFDVPGTPDDYTHRVGRTGRAERSGMAYTFAAVDELPAVHAIERKLKSKIPRRDPPEFSLATAVSHEPRERIAKVEPSEPDSMNRPRRRRRRTGLRRSPRKHNGTTS